MKWYRKVLVGVCVMALLLVLLDIGINMWIRVQLPKIINKSHDFEYKITYDELSISLLKSSFTAGNVVIVPKAGLANTERKTIIYAKVKNIKVRGFKILNILFSDKIKAKSITIDQPNWTLYKNNTEVNIRESVQTPFEKIISVSDVFLNHGNLKMIYVKNKKTILRAHNINFQVDGIFMSDSTMDKKIPLKFKNYNLSCDSIYYSPNPFYHLKTKMIKVTNTDLSIDHFEMIPNYSRRGFVAKIPKEDDLYTLTCKSIKASKIKWGFNEDNLFFQCSLVDLNHLAANIYRSKTPADDLSKKYFYNKLLRDLKFDLKVDTLKVRNSILEYEEEKEPELGAGKLTFNSFNLTATNVNSGFSNETIPDVKIKINCQFMNTSPLNVNWKFNVMDKSDGFNINGRLTNFDAEKIIPFTKPYLNVTTKGIIDELHFNFNGNDKISKGELGVKYDDLKFTIYKKDNPKKKNKLLTFVAKIFVKKDTKDKVKDAKIEVERIPEKSFYNLLWRSIAEGLKKILV